jgi:hypothetical protein
MPFQDLYHPNIYRLRGPLQTQQETMQEPKISEAQYIKLTKPTVSYPRLQDLPRAERIAFRKVLCGQTVPIDPNDDVHDRYYPWDYKRWKAGLPVID